VGAADLRLASLSLEGPADVNATATALVAVANAGSGAGEALVSLLANGTALGNATVEVPPNGTATARISFVPPAGGDLALEAEMGNATLNATAHVRAPDFDDVGFGAQGTATCGVGQYALKVRNTGDGLARRMVAHVTLFAESGEVEQDVDSPAQDLAANATADFNGPIGRAEGCRAPQEHRVLVTIQADGVLPRRYAATATL